MMTVSRQSIQDHIYKYPLQDKPHGATHKRNKDYFKIKNGRVYYYHASQNKWFMSSLFTTKDLHDPEKFFKC